MSIKHILEVRHQELLNELSQKASIYNFWHVTLNINDLRNIVDQLEEIERELGK